MFVSNVYSRVMVPSAMVVISATPPCGYFQASQNISGLGCGLPQTKIHTRSTGVYLNPNDIFITLIHPV